MLKKIAIAALISSFAVASFAATDKKAEPAAPAAAEQKADAPQPAKHAKKHHHKKAAEKAEKAEAPATK